MITGFIRGPRGIEHQNIKVIQIAKRYLKRLFFIHLAPFANVLFNTNTVAVFCLKYLRMIYLFTCFSSVEAIIFGLVNMFMGKIRTLSIKQTNWKVFPRIFTVLLIFLNIFSNCFLLFRYKIVRDETIHGPEHQSSELETLSDDIVYVYITMNYYVVTTITGVGFGDIVPLNIYEYMLASILLVWGVFLYGFVIAKIKMMMRTSFSSLDIRSNNLEEVDSILIRLESKRKINLFDDKVNPFRHYEPVVWNCKMTHFLMEKYDAIRLFRKPYFWEMPFPIKKDLFKRYLYELKNEFSGFFKMLGPILNFEIVNIMEMRICFRNQIIINKNDFSDGFYLIYKGRAELLYCQNSNTELFHFARGGILGESIILNNPEQMTSR